MAWFVSPTGPAGHLVTRQAGLGQPSDQAMLGHLGRRTNGGFVSSLDGIACPTSKSCLAVGQSVSDAGLILKSNGITANWKQTFMDPAHPSWSDISIYKTYRAQDEPVSRLVSVAHTEPLSRRRIVTARCGEASWFPSGVEELDGVSC